MQTDLAVGLLSSEGPTPFALTCATRAATSISDCATAPLRRASVTIAQTLPTDCQLGGDLLNGAYRLHSAFPSHTIVAPATAV